MKTLPTTLLQIFFKNILNYEDIVKSNVISDDNFWCWQLGGLHYVSVWLTPGCAVAERRRRRPWQRQDRVTLPGPSRPRDLREAGEQVVASCFVVTASFLATPLKQTNSLR